MKPQNIHHAKINLEHTGCKEDKLNNVTSITKIIEKKKLDAARKKIIDAAKNLAW